MSAWTPNPYQWQKINIMQKIYTSTFKYYPDFFVGTTHVEMLWKMSITVIFRCQTTRPKLRKTRKCSVNLLTSFLDKFFFLHLYFQFLKKDFRKNPNPISVFLIITPVLKKCSSTRSAPSSLRNYMKSKK